MAAGGGLPASGGGGILAAGTDWQELRVSRMSAWSDGLALALDARPRRTLDAAGRLRAAVLVPLFERAGDLRLLLTKRTAQVEHHKGQISFPGGVHEPVDGTLERTALRESEEEIGLAADRVRILGRLDDVTPRVTPFIITPIVALIAKPDAWRLNSDEVERVLEAAVRPLLADGAIAEEPIPLQDGSTVMSPAFRCGGEWVWGATARVVGQLVAVLRGVL